MDRRRALAADDVVFDSRASSLAKDGESKAKSKSDTSKGKGKKKKKRKNSEEALEDSDDGDYEGLEVDYMSDESRCVSHKHALHSLCPAVMLL